MNVDTTHNGGPRLAQELLDLTLDHLHYDIKSLKQSALVSKSLLPTCQRHLFSTFRITEKLAKLFASPSPTDGDDEDDDLRDRIVDLLDAYTTHLILTDDPRLVSAFGEKKAYLPEFKNVQKITFKGDELPSAVTIPSFLVQTWMSPSSRLRTVEFDFRSMGQNGILESLYLLPAAVENVSFTCTGEVEGTRYHSTAASIRSTIRHRFPPEVYRPGVHQISGTLKLRLVPMFNDLLPVMLELKDLFKFGLKWINCRITSRQNIGTLASLVDQCEDTLQFLDIPISSLRAYRAQHTVPSRFLNTTTDVFPPLRLLGFFWSIFRFLSPSCAQTRPDLDPHEFRTQVALHSSFHYSDSFNHESKGPISTDRTPRQPSTLDDVPGLQIGCSRKSGRDRDTLDRCRLAIVTVDRPES